VLLIEPRKSLFCFCPPADNLLDEGKHMERKYKVAMLASVLLWPLLAWALATCFTTLPTTDHPFARPYHYNHTWLGQGPAAACLNGLVLLVVIYGVKYIIGRVTVRWVRVYFFALLVISSLPNIWLFIALDWRNMHVFRISCWVYDPVGLWVIPCISFTADARAMRPPELAWYIARSCLEFLLMLPWLYAWVFISFFCLGGGWI
jgi:hypothetical protein